MSSIVAPFLVGFLLVLGAVLAVSLTGSLLPDMAEPFRAGLAVAGR